jgi:Uma2 family endonuclease
MEAIAYENLPHYSYEDYLKWDGRWEIINGIAYAMSPAPSPKHQKITFKIAKELDSNFECNKKECEVYIAPVDWKISDDTVVQPDVAIFCENPTQYFSTTPPLVVEVLSKATALKDVTTKFKLYEKADVEYYILVEPNSEVFDVYKLEANSFKHIKKGTKIDKIEFEFNNGCKSAIDFTKVFS